MTPGRRRGAGLAALLVFCACGGAASWQKPGAEAFRYLRQGELFDRCMARRGYSRADTG